MYTFICDDHYPSHMYGLMTITQVIIVACSCLWLTVIVCCVYRLTLWSQCSLVLRKCWWRRRRKQWVWSLSLSTMPTGVQWGISWPLSSSWLSSSCKVGHNRAVHSTQVLSQWLHLWEVVQWLLSIELQLNHVHAWDCMACEIVGKVFKLYCSLPQCEWLVALLLGIQ